MNQARAGFLCRQGKVSGPGRIDGEGKVHLFFGPIHGGVCRGVDDHIGRFDTDDGNNGIRIRDVDFRQIERQAVDGCGEPYA